MKRSTSTSRTNRAAPASDRTVRTAAASKQKSTKENHNNQGFEQFHNNLQVQSPNALAMMKCFTQGDTHGVLERFNESSMTDSAERLWLGWAYANSGEWILAAEQFKLALQAGIPAHGFLADAYLQLKCHSERQELLLAGRSACVNTHPVLEAVFWREVGVQYFQDSPQASLEPFGNARTAAKKSKEGMVVLPSIAYRHAQALINVGDDNAAILMLNHALEFATATRVPWLLHTITHAHLNLGDFSTAYKLIRRLDVHKTGQPILAAYIADRSAQLEVALKRFDTAADAYEQQAQKPDAEFRFYAHVQLAWIYANTNRSLEANIQLDKARCLDYVSTDRERLYLAFSSAKIHTLLDSTNAVRLAVVALRATRDLGQTREAAHCHLLIAEALIPAIDEIEELQLPQSKLKAIQFHLEKALKCAKHHKTAFLQALLNSKLELILYYNILDIPHLSKELETTSREFRELQQKIKFEIIKNAVQNHQWEAALVEYKTNKTSGIASPDQVFMVFIAACATHKLALARKLMLLLKDTRFYGNACLQFQNVSEPPSDKNDAAIHFISCSLSSQSAKFHVEFTPQHVDAIVEISRTDSSNTNYVFRSIILYDQTRKNLIIAAYDSLIDSIVPLNLYDIPHSKYLEFESWLHQ
jgi:hypothetical protein